MINMLFGEVNVIRWRYVRYLNNSHPTLSLIAYLNISTCYLATYLHVYFNDKCKKMILSSFFSVISHNIVWTCSYFSSYDTVASLPIL